MKRTVSRRIGAAMVAVVSAALIGSSMGAAGAQSSDLPTISIAMDRTSITVAGALQSGAVDIVSTTTNEGVGAPMLVRLNDGVTADEFLAALATPLLQDPNNVVAFGSIVLNAVSPMGTTDVQTTLAPGDYLAFDTRANDPTKWPHVSFSITEAAQPMTLPAADATVHAIEFAFRSPKTIHDGDLVRFQNDGFLVHMIIGLRAANASDARQMAELLLAGKDAKAGRLIRGVENFMSPVSNGAVQQVTLDAKPGVYVLACFMATQDGREHTRLGMVGLVRVAA